MGHTEWRSLTRTSCCWKINVRSNKNRNKRRGKQQLNEKGGEWAATYVRRRLLSAHRTNRYTQMPRTQTHRFISRSWASGILFYTTLSQSPWLPRNFRINNIWNVVAEMCANCEHKRSKANYLVKFTKRAYWTPIHSVGMCENISRVAILFVRYRLIPET